jgi:hypothetical protein
VIVKPAATAVALGVLCNALIFPESTSHIVLRNMKEVLAGMTEFVDACRVSLERPRQPMELGKLRAAKNAGLAKYKALEANLGFLPLDVSVSRWNVEDIALLTKPLRRDFMAWAALLESHTTRAESKARLERLLKMDEVTTDETDEKAKRFGRHQLAQQLDFVHLFRTTAADDLIVKSVDVLRETAGPLLETCKAALEAAVETLQLVNEQKFSFRGRQRQGDAGVEARHRKLLETLRRDCETLLENTPSRLMDSHAHLFDEQGHLDPPPGSGVSPLRGVMLCLILEERIVSFAHALEQLLGQMVALQEQRRQTRLWFPTGLRRLGAWVFGREPAPQVTPVTAEEEEPAKEKGRTTNGFKRPSSDVSEEQQDTPVPAMSERLASTHLRQSKHRHPLGRLVLGVAGWLSNGAGTFALRIVVVTIAFAIPAVVPSSAGFYVREKGLWALIMAQMSLVPYAADFTWGVILRVTGTVVGGVLGMAAWYIGAGNGPGNPYGMAAVMAPLIVVLMYGRLFGPPALLQVFMISAATVYLTVAYSWVDTHIPSYGNPGVGYTVFWRRILLVLVGFAGAAVVMYFPRPPSAGRHYRQVLSATLSGLQDLYAVYLTDFDAKVESRVPDITAAVAKPVIATAETLSAIAGPVRLLRFELSAADFTAGGLSRVTALATAVNFNLFQMIHYSSQLPEDFRVRFRLLSGAFDQRFVGDLMAVLSLVGHSLESGEALPAVLPAPLLIRAFRDRVVRLEGSEEHIGTLLGPVTRNMVEKDRGGAFRKYCLSLSALVGLLNAVDEMVLVVKEELGESHVLDIESWAAGGGVLSEPQVDVEVKA